MMRIAAINTTDYKTYKNNKQHFGSLPTAAEINFRYGEISSRFGAFINLKNVSEMPDTVLYAHGRMIKLGEKGNFLPWEQDSRVVLGLMRLLNGETFEPIAKL